MTTLGELRVAAPADAATPLNYRALLYAWLTAGTLDILSAITWSMLYGGSALGVLRSVASGLIGARAKGAGWDVGLLGLALHFAIMLGIVLVYQLASRRLLFLPGKPLLYGPAYGIAVYAFMQRVVLPLSAVTFTPSHAWDSVLIGITIHMLCVGLPIALILSRFGADAPA